MIRKDKKTDGVSVDPYQLDRCWRGCYCNLRGRYYTGWQKIRMTQLKTLCVSGNCVDSLVQNAIIIDDAISAAGLAQDFPPLSPSQRAQPSCLQQRPGWREEEVFYSESVSQTLRLNRLLPHTEPHHLCTPRPTQPNGSHGYQDPLHLLCTVNQCILEWLLWSHFFLWV